MELAAEGTTEGAPVELEALAGVKDEGEFESASVEGARLGE